MKEVIVFALLVVVIGFVAICLFPTPLQHNAQECAKLAFDACGNLLAKR